MRLYLREGRLEQARQTAELLRDAMPGQCESRAGTFLETRASYSMMRARLLLAQGDAGQAVALLEPLRVETASAGRWYLDAAVSILLALALEQDAATDKALALLEHALAIAQSRGMFNSFVDEGKPLRALMERWRRTSVSVASFDAAFLDRMFAAFNAQGGRAGPAAAQSARAASALLSVREIEILDHIARGLSNKEIARALRVAPETVKWHLKNVFEKLNVSSRVEAVQSGLGLTRSN